MSVNVNGIYYVHVSEQARWACSAGTSAIENVCIIIKLNSPFTRSASIQFFSSCSSKSNGCLGNNAIENLRIIIKLSPPPFQEVPRSNFSSSCSSKSNVVATIKRTFVAVNTNLRLRTYNFAATKRLQLQLQPPSSCSSDRASTPTKPHKRFARGEGKKGAQERGAQSRAFRAVMVNTGPPCGFQVAGPPGV